MQPRFRDSEGKEVRQFGSVISEPLRQHLLFWVTRLSYSDASCLIEQMAGQRQFSEDAVWRLVQKESHRLDMAQKQRIEESLSVPEPISVAPSEESLYDSTATEFVAMTDGIGVKAQKPTREKAGESRQPKVQKRHDTDVLILPHRDGSEEIVCEGVSSEWTLVGWPKPS